VNAARSAESSQGVTGWDHARAIALLPFLNTVVLPGVILWSTGYGDSRPSDFFNWTDVAAVCGGALMLTAGASLIASSIRLFVRLGNGTLAPWDPPRTLVRSGPYRYCRNPMKIGLFLALLGEALLLRSAALFGWFACFAIANVVYVRWFEERGLLERFGASYRDYCAQVPRWLPTVKRRSSERQSEELA
jgi:protein-S-isoprenylcysteine O-methyltransferase Ste14